MTYSKLKLVHFGGAPCAQAAAAKCDPHESKSDLLAFAHVDITRSGDFRYNLNAQKSNLLPLITASYIMLGELLEQLSNTK